MIKSLLSRIKLYFFKKIINSNNAWSIYDKSNIPGFGTNLIRLYFPVYYDNNSVRDSFSDDYKKNISEIFDEYSYSSYIEIIINFFKNYYKVPLVEKNDTLPYLDNYFFTYYDACVMASIFKVHQPKKIIEIGSGISTRYMLYFINELKLNTQIICIDPFPRANINKVANHIILKPLEGIFEDSNIFTEENIQANDIVFMDGSHYCFQGNDTLTFFFKLLPQLPHGVIIHIHDIYLPNDYSIQTSRQLWNEQYILAAMIQSGLKGYRILFPSNYVSTKNTVLRDSLNNINIEIKKNSFSKTLDQSIGVSFWMIKE